MQWELSNQADRICCREVMSYVVCMLIARVRGPDQVMPPSTSSMCGFASGKERILTFCVLHQCDKHSVAETHGNEYRSTESAAFAHTERTTSVL